MYVYNRSRLMGLDYILNIYCYSESHASCEANHQVKQNNKCQVWRRCVARRPYVMLTTCQISDKN